MHLRATSRLGVIPLSHRLLSETANNPGGKYDGVKFWGMAILFSRFSFASCTTD